MSPFQLKVRNAWRWFCSNGWSWVGLGIPYVFGVGLLLEPFIEPGHREAGVTPTFFKGFVAAVFLGALFIQWVSQQWDLTMPVRMQRGSGRVYFLAQVRELWTILMLLGVAFASAVFAPLSLLFWIFLVQVPVQKQLYSLQRWRTVFLLAYPGSGAWRLVSQLRFQQVVLFVLLWLGLGVWFAVSGLASLEFWLEMGWIGLGAVLAAVSVALEGDSGRPILVQLISFTVGTLGGIACFASPWSLILVAYFSVQLQKVSVNRLKSVENFYEDTVVS